MVRRRRPGLCGAYTMPEVLISAAVFILLLGLLLGVYTGSMKGFFKGEDALTSTQDATVLMLHLRRDLQRLDLAGGESISYRKVHASGTASARLDFDAASRCFTRHVTSVLDGVTLPEGGLCLRFPARRGDAVSFVQYTYDPSASAIERLDVDMGERKLFGLPRLQDFSLRLQAHPAGLPPADLFEGDGSADGRALRQFWFEMRMTMRSDGAEGPEIRRTSVSLSTNVFPKRANHLLASSWAGDGS